MKRFAFIALLALAACTPPTVINYNGDSVTILSSSAQVNHEIWSEAQRICRDRGLNAEYAASRTSPATWESAHLFLCLHNPKPNAGLPGAVTLRTNYLETTSSL